VVVTPPVGIVVSVLPPLYTTVWVRGVPYYYADDIYYTQGPGGYVVVTPPNATEVSTAAPGGPANGPGGVPAADDFFIYPKNQQTPDQQARDRYECHSWAVQQTGFDPTQTSGGVPPGVAGQKRADYRRAMSACLEARGYTVK
jgi:hypothetical protein